MIPASAIARSASAITRSDGSSLRTRAVERAQLLALLRAAHDDAAAVQRVEVEHVQRAAEREHDVVRHVDDVRDRAHTREAQPRLEPDRATRRSGRRGTGGRCSAGSPLGPRPARRPARRRCAEARSDRAARARRRRAPPPRARSRRPRADRRRLPVASISSTSSTSGSTSASGVPGVERVVEHHDPVVVGAEVDLVLGEDHPLGHFAAQLAPLERQPVRQGRAGKRDRDFRARAEVPGAADDLVRLVLADVDLRQLQPVRVRMLLRLEHDADLEERRGRRGRRGARRRSPRRTRSRARARSARSSRRCGRTRAASSAGLSSELPQEAEVVLPEGADARNAVPELRRSLDAHAEREAGVLLRAPADELVQIRVDHARAAHLEPAGVLARRRSRRRRTGSTRRPAPSTAP